MHKPASAWPWLGSADVLVIFGITGDLAKKMTFRSLYRLERRKMLDCPIVGVARNDWSAATPARPRTAGHRGRRRDHRRGRVPAFRGAAVDGLGRLRRSRDLQTAGQCHQGPPLPGLLPGDPAVALRSGGGGPRRRRPDEERQGRGREAVRARPGLGAGPQRRAAQARSTSGRSCASTTSSARSRRWTSSSSGSPTRSSSRSGTATASSASRSRWPRLRRRGSRQLLRPRRRAQGRRPEPPAADRRPRRLRAADRRRRRRPAGQAGRGLPGDTRHRPQALRARAVRRLPVGAGSGPDSQTETFAAVRLEIDNWRWSGVPFFIRAGKCLAATVTEVRVDLQAAATAGLGADSSRRTATSSSSASTRTPAPT